MKTPIYTFFGYISAKDIIRKELGQTLELTLDLMFGLYPLKNLKPITEFKNER